MKQIFKSRSILASLMTGFAFVLLLCTFTSCGDDENIPDVTKGKYAFVDPCMKWGIDETELRDQMKGMTDWREESEITVANRIDFVNKKTQAQISYTFEDNKLVETDVTYFSCNDKFEQMKSDWTKALNLTWTENVIFGHVVYLSTCDERECKVNLQYGSNMGIDYMTASFEYNTFPF